LFIDRHPQSAILPSFPLAQKSIRILHLSFLLVQKSIRILHLSFPRKRESIRVRLTASFPNGFLLAQE
jgi:hypothetical protein